MHKTSLYNTYNNVSLVLFSIITSIILLGIISPIFAEAIFGKSIFIAEKYYNTTITPLVLALILVCTLFHRQKRMKASTIYFLLLALFCTTSILSLVEIESTIYCYIPILFATLLLAMLSITALKKPSTIIEPFFIAHIGFALLVASTAIHYKLKNESRFILHVGETVKFANHELYLSDISYRHKKNYLSKTAEILIDNSRLATPEIRYFPIERSQTAEVHITKYIFYDLYISINSTNKAEELYMDVKTTPLMNIIWLSCSLICLSGLISFLRSLIKRQLY